MKHNSIKTIWVAGCLLVAGSPAALGQWQTQSFDLAPGWNAIYTHVDTMHSGIAALANNTPVNEVWMWKPPVSTAQYVTSPDEPSDAKSRWASWKSVLGDNSSVLKRMSGNTAYLVKLGGNVNYTWSVKGKPVPPRYQWTTTGLNFFGVPSVPSNPKSLEDYFADAGYLLQNTKIFAYGGGDISSTNPGQVYGLRKTLAKRGQAYWMDAGTQFNRYFGPFSVKLQSVTGAHFGDHLSAYRLRLRNMTAADLTVTLAGVDSEPVPSGETAIAAAAPVLVRGALDTATLAYAHSVLSAGAQTWTLKPAGTVGSEVEVVLGLDRTTMTGVSGTLYASLLRLTDSLGHSQVDIPVSGKVGSSEGLWIGKAGVSQVRHSLATDTTTFGEVGSAYPLRLILHKEKLSGVTVSRDGAHTVVTQGTGKTVTVTSLPRPLYAGEAIAFSGGGVLTLTANAPANSVVLTGDLTGASIAEDETGGANRLKLLQRVFVGTLASGNTGVAVKQSLLDPDELDTAQRISCIHLPVSINNLPWVCGGDLASGQAISVTVDVGYNDQASNPFVHTYHPDHDNLAADFKTVQPVGRESYKIRREIKLTFEPPGRGFASLTRTGRQLLGTYEETMTLFGLATSGAANEKSYAMKGAFVLNRISDIATLETE